MAKLGIAVKLYLHNDDNTKTTLYGFEQPLEPSAMATAQRVVGQLTESLKELIV
jgi:hypothetical protein